MHAKKLPAFSLFYACINSYHTAFWGGGILSRRMLLADICVACGTRCSFKPVIVRSQHIRNDTVLQGGHATLHLAVRSRGQQAPLSQIKNRVTWEKRFGSVWEAACFASDATGEENRVARQGCLRVSVRKKKHQTFSVPLRQHQKSDRTDSDEWSWGSNREARCGT